MNRKDITCDLLREKHKTLSQQQETCSRLLATKGPLTEVFIDAFLLFEEQKRELSELLKERREYFSFLRNLFFEDNVFQKMENREFEGDTIDSRIQDIFDRFKTKKKALAYLFNCREDQITEMGEEVSDDTVYHNGRLSLPGLTAFETLPEGFSFPEYMGGELYLRSLRSIPESTVFPKCVGGNLDLERLIALPRQVTFPRYVGGFLDLNSVSSLPGGFVFPEHIKGFLTLTNLTDLPAGVTFPERVDDGIDLSNLTVLPEDFTFPEHLGGDLILNKALRNNPSLPAIPDSVEGVRWVNGG